MHQTSKTRKSPVSSYGQRNCACKLGLETLQSLRESARKMTTQMHLAHGCSRCANMLTAVLTESPHELSSRHKDTATKNLSQAQLAQRVRRNGSWSTCGSRP
eukprot:5054408-Amphidinium_carterae.1